MEEKLKAEKAPEKTSESEYPFQFSEKTITRHLWNGDSRKILNRHKQNRAYCDNQNW